MKRSFVYQAQPMRVRFGAGSLKNLDDELAAIGGTRAVVITTPEHRGLGERVNTQLATAGRGVYANAKMHVPASIIDDALAFIRDAGADTAVCVGGGSTTGLGKALALRSDLLILAVPTTYAGSEMTPIWGITDNGIKRTGRDARVLPRSVIYDPELTVSLPVKMSISSGFNAVAHAVEGLYAPDASPITSLMAAQGVETMLHALPTLAGDPMDLDARSDALYAAWLCGATLGATTMGLHHKLCHILGGSFNLPHAETHAVVLPHVMAFNLTSTAEAREVLQRATRSTDPSTAISKLRTNLDIPNSLKALGMPESGIAEAVTQAMVGRYSNPREITDADLLELLTAAYNGEDPVKAFDADESTSRQTRV